MTLTIQAAEQWPLAIFSDLGCCQIRVDICLRVVMRRHLMPFATLLI
jgi:hypothetical protein